MQKGVFRVTFATTLSSFETNRVIVASYKLIYTCGLCQSFQPIQSKRNNQLSQYFSGMSFGAGLMTGGLIGISLGAYAVFGGIVTPLIFIFVGIVTVFVACYMLWRDERKKLFSANQAKTNIENDLSIPTILD